MAQSSIAPNGAIHTELFMAPSGLREMYSRMDERKSALEANGHQQFQRRAVGRNASCPCGSGFKFKKCCIGRASGA